MAVNDAEVARLEQEIVRLRAQQKNFAKGMSYLPLFCAAMALFVLWFLVDSIRSGSTGGIIAAVLILLFLGLLALFSRDPATVEFLADGLSFYPVQTHAASIVRKIAECERRIAELKYEAARRQ